MTPPAAEKHPKTITQHGETRTDDYFWLRDGDRPRIEAHLHAENDYTKWALGAAEPLERKIYAEMLGRLQETDMSAPVPFDGYEYFVRTFEGKQYPVYCRRKQDAEEVLLDANALAAGEKYFRLGNYAVSPDHRLLAYSVDLSGDEVYTTCVKDLATGALLPDRIENTYYGLAWTNDGRSLVYITLDEAKRPYQAWRHTLGGGIDELLLEESDERFHLTLGKTRSRRFIFLELNSAASSEVHYLDASDGGGRPVCFAARRHDIEYELEHQGDIFYLRTTDGGRNYRVLTVPVANPSMEHAREWIGHREEVMIEAVDAFSGHVVVTERDRGLLQLRIHQNGGDWHTVSMPEPAYALYPAENLMYDTREFRFSYSSLVTPTSVFSYDMDTRERRLIKQMPVLGGYDASRYETKRLFATSPDGVKVPVSLVHRRGMVLDGRNPMLLYGYGSYGISIDAAFSADRVSLLERGFVYGIAHIRGGGDLGKTWHDAGKLKQKRNTFEDFIAAAEFVIREGYTSPEKLAILGGSAGGLLMGAVINQRPDLFRAVVAKVPFVDVLNTATDPTLPLTVIEYDEWGNSNEREYWDYIRSYSPYDNVRAQPYPHVLATAGLNDPRVSYWEPAKWIAKLRTVNTSGSMLLLKTNMDAGHGGASGRYERMKETAFDYAFILYALGMATA